jgi:GTP-binding protein EngB required for normal cell division
MTGGLATGTTSAAPCVNNPTQRPLAHLLGVVAETTSRFALQNLASRAHELLATVSRADQVDVVVLGRFKSGKSSLLNALLGRNVLPIDVLPATAVVTCISSGSSDCARVVSEDGGAEEVDLSDLALFVTEQHNPDNVRRVARVDIELERVETASGLRFVDTPGVGSVHRHNTEATRRWLPRVGAALVAISADQPLSDQDASLLAELESSTPVVTIVLTKADLVGPEQLQAIETYVVSRVQAHLARPVKVIPVSVRPGHEARLGALRRFLVDGIAGHRKEVAQSILAHKVHVLADTCRDYLAVALEAARADADARAELETEIEKERRAVALVDRELSLIAGYFRGRALDVTEKRFLAHRRELTRELRLELSSAASRWRGDLASETRSFRGWLAPALTSRLTHIGEEGGDVWADLVDQAGVGVRRVAQAFRDRLSGKVRQALGIDFAGAAFEATPSPPARPSLALGRVFDTHVDLLWFLVPMPLFRPLVHRHFRQAIAWEVEKHLYRLAAQWTDAIGSAVNALGAAARAYVHGELDALSALLVQAPDRTRDIEQAITRLDQARRATSPSAPPTV